MNLLHESRRLAANWFRPKRAAKMFAVLEMDVDTKVFDCGGAVDFWRNAPFVPAVTIGNIDPREVSAAQSAGMIGIECDARNLPFGDMEFDAVVCNSVIEHLDVESRPQVVAELQRVGRRVWIQTPAAEFPIEPHFVGPNVPWIPLELRIGFIRYASLWGLNCRPTRTEIAEAVRGTRLLSRKELSGLASTGSVLVERFLYMPKSYVLYSQRD